jgi:hypothetical protein
MPMQHICSANVRIPQLDHNEDISPDEGGQQMNNSQWEVAQQILLEKFNSFAPMSLTSTLRSPLLHYNMSPARVTDFWLRERCRTSSVTLPCLIRSSTLLTNLLHPARHYAMYD